ncbi:hypothetical protein ABEW34_31245 [Paenibacillus algorifonticola]|uniref:hemoblobin-interacting domain-containing protein n=1 Tax=Paenibacillus algorifonticola TaxID=684063 RepID=UPI003D2CD066
MFTEWLRVTKQEQLIFRLVSIILALVIAMSILPNVAMAATVPVSNNLSMLSLETNSAMVTQGKVKVNGINPAPNANAIFATLGQATAQTAPEEGTAFSTLANLYSYKLNDNFFVPANAGEIISIVEVDSQNDKVIGYTSLIVGVNHMGAIPPLVDLGIHSKELINNHSYLLYGEMFYESPNRVTFSNVTSSNYSIVSVSRYGDEFSIYGFNSGTAKLSFDVSDNRTGDKIRKTIDITVRAYRAPYLYESADALFAGAQVSINVAPTDSQWSLDSVKVNGEIISSENYTYVKGGIQDRDTILFHAGVLSEGYNLISLESYDYGDGLIELQIHRSEQSFYMSEPLIDKTNGGLSASVRMARNIHNESYSGMATVIFQLMNGNVPVDMVSFTIGALNEYQTSRAHFNLADATTNPNYSVRAFLITGDNSEPNNIGYNLATQVNDAEFDQHFEELKNWR